jgi:hypothetical protein
MPVTVVLDRLVTCENLMGCVDDVVEVRLRREVGD